RAFFQRTTHKSPPVRISETPVPLKAYFGAKRGPGRRRRRIAAFDGFRLLRVLPPLASTPVGLHGFRPPEVRPSPPPIGWLTGFCDTPRLCGFLPIQRSRPALPTLMFMWSALPVLSIVPRQSE